MLSPNAPHRQRRKVQLPHNFFIGRSLFYLNVLFMRATLKYTQTPNDNGNGETSNKTTTTSDTSSNNTSNDKQQLHLLPQYPFSCFHTDFFTLLLLSIFLFVTDVKQLRRGPLRLAHTSSLVGGGSLVGSVVSYYFGVFSPFLFVVETLCGF